MRKNITFLIDADDIVYQCNQTALDAVNKEGNTHYTMNDIVSWGPTGNKVIDGRTKLFSNPDFIRNMPLYDGAQDFIKELQKIGEVFFGTAVSPECMTARAEALMRDFDIDARHIIIASNKSLIKADFHLDDNADNIKSSSAIHAVLFRRPWNYELSGIPAVSRYEDFITYVKYISSCPDNNNSLPSKPIICLVAPTGAGKTDFVLDAYSKGYAVPLSLTTRKTNKFNYKSISKDAFLSLKESGSFLETTVYGGESYGILKGDKAFDADKSIVPIDICGAISFKNHFPDRTVLIYLNTPKQECVKSILNREGDIEEKTRALMSLEAELLNENLCDFSVSSFTELTKIL